MALEEHEVEMINRCCEINENIIITAVEKKEKNTYRSRFLFFDPKKNFIIVDVPSAETKGSKPLSKNQQIQCFFEYNYGAGFRYIFDSKVIDHTRFKISDRGIYAFKISFPSILKDGERREYFRVATDHPSVPIKFHIYKHGEKTPIMSLFDKEKPETYKAKMLDISGGGFAFKSEKDSKRYDLETHDIIHAEFKLEPGDSPLSIWSIIRGKRRFKNTESFIYGVQFIEDARNKMLKSYRNKIMRYVIKRQRELIK